MIEDLQASRAGTAGTERTTVYVDTPALFLGGAADPDVALLAPDAATALHHLRAAGLEVVLLGGGIDVTAGLEGAVGGWPRLPELPEDPQGWMVVAAVAACTQGRPRRRLRTLLVGPAAPAPGFASRSCDVVARDLTDAALTILAAEAMAPPREVAGRDEARDALGDAAASVEATRGVSRASSGRPLRHPGIEPRESRRPRPAAC